MNYRPDQISEAAAGRPPEFIEMLQVRQCHKAAAARLWGR
jgi:hypothetical protein